MQKTKARETFKNLFLLVELDLITTNTLSLYLYYKIHISEEVTLKQIQTFVGLSASATQVHNRLLESLRLLKLDRPNKPGKPNTVERVSGLSNEKLKKLLSDNQLLSDIVSIKEERFNKYNLDAYEAKGSSYKGSKYNNKKKSVEASAPEVVTIVIQSLPAAYRHFRVVPKQLKELRKLDKQVDLAKYTKWFYQKKIKSGLIKNFNLGIFLYLGITTEYKTEAASLKKVEAIKKTRSASSANIQKKKKKASRSSLEAEFK